MIILCVSLVMLVFTCLKMEPVLMPVLGMKITSDTFSLTTLMKMVTQFQNVSMNSTVLKVMVLTGQIISVEHLMMMRSRLLTALPSIGMMIQLPTFTGVMNVSSDITSETMPLMKFLENCILLIAIPTSGLEWKITSNLITGEDPYLIGMISYQMMTEILFGSPFSSHQ